MALKELREASKSWVASILVGILVISFALWGINDMFGKSASRGVAKVGDAWVSPASFQRSLRSAYSQAEAQAGGKLTPDQVEAMHLPDVVLSRVIDQTALDVMADHIGLALSDKSLASAIQSDKSFQGMDGKFDDTTYQQILAANNLSPAQYESLERVQLIRLQLVDAVASGAYLPTGLVSDLILYRGEMRAVSYVPVGLSAITQVASPDDKTLKAFIAKHTDKFMRPELRTFVAVTFKPKDFVGDVKVSDADIKSQYQYDIAKYTVPEKRQVRDIAFPSEAAAKAAYAEITAGKKTFEQVGKSLGYSDADLAFKDKTKQEVADSTVADAAFAAGKPGLLAPVNGQLAWALVDVGKVTPGKTTPLDQVKDEIRSKLALDRAGDLIQKKVDAFEDARAGGSTIEEAAKSLGLKVLHFDQVDAGGTDAHGKAVAATPDDKQIVAAAFAAEEGAENDPDILNTSGQYVIRVDAVMPPAVKPFDEIAAQARKDYIAETQDKRLKDKADELAKTHGKDGLSGVAAALATQPVKLPSPLRRGAKSDVLSAALAKSLFDAKAGALIVGKAASGDTYLVAAVTGIQHPNQDELKKGVQTTGAELSSELGDDLLTEYIAGAKSRLGVKVDKTAFQTASSSVPH